MPTSKNEIYSMNHVNTAVTTSCIPNSQIIIYRMEEWFKVFIHETFHVFGLDFSHMSSSIYPQKQKLKQVFSIQSDFLIFEAYCEFWATFFNVFFQLKKQYKNSSSSIFLSKMRQQLQKEQTFSIQQMNKILQSMNLTYTSLFDKTKSIQYQEDTNVFAYYILKSILLYFYDDFIQWTKQHSIQNNYICIEKTSSTIHSFVDFLIEYSQHPDFIQTTQSISINKDNSMKMTTTKYIE